MLFLRTLVGFSVLLVPAAVARVVSPSSKISTSTIHTTSGLSSKTITTTGVNQGAEVIVIVPSTVHTTRTTTSGLTLKTITTTGLNKVVSVIVDVPSTIHTTRTTTSGLTGKTITTTGTNKVVSVIVDVPSTLYTTISTTSGLTRKTVTTTGTNKEVFVVIDVPSTRYTTISTTSGLTRKTITTTGTNNEVFVIVDVPSTLYTTISTTSGLTRKTLTTTGANNEVSVIVDVPSTLYTTVSTTSGLTRKTVTTTGPNNEITVVVDVPSTVLSTSTSTFSSSTKSTLSTTSTIPDTSSTPSTSSSTTRATSTTETTYSTSSSTTSTSLSSPSISISSSASSTSSISISSSTSATSISSSTSSTSVTSSTSSTSISSSASSTSSTSSASISSSISSTSSTSPTASIIPTSSTITSSSTTTLSLITTLSPIATSSSTTTSSLITTLSSTPSTSSTTSTPSIASSSTSTTSSSFSTTPSTTSTSTSSSTTSSSTASSSTTSSLTTSSTTSSASTSTSSLTSSSASLTSSTSSTPSTSSTSTISSKSLTSSSSNPSSSTSSSSTSASPLPSQYFAIESAYQDAFQVYNPVPVNPSGASSICGPLQVIQHSFANSYGSPAVVTMEPPSCGTGFTAATFTLQNVGEGTQYDRLIILSLGNGEVWRSSTFEPISTGTYSYHTKDMTFFTALLKVPQIAILEIDNIVESGLPGIFNVTLTAEYFYGTTQASTPPDRNFGLSRLLGGQGKTSYFQLANGAWGNTTVSKIPQNGNKATVTIIASGGTFGDGNTDEFWWSGSSNTFREVQIYIDGVFAGGYWPFPQVYTGGVQPSYWRPIVGINAYDAYTATIDVTPFLGMLSDGKSHVFSLTVAGGGDGWFVSGFFNVWEGTVGTVTTGTGFSSSAANSAVITNSGMDATRSYTISAIINGALYSWGQSLTFANVGYGPTINGTDTVNGVPVMYSWDISYSQVASNGVSQLILDQEFHHTELGIDTSLSAKAAASGSVGYASTSQSYTSPGYSRTLTATNGVIVSDTHPAASDQFSKRLTRRELSSRYSNSSSNSKLKSGLLSSFLGGNLPVSLTNLKLIVASINAQDGFNVTKVPKQVIFAPPTALTQGAKFYVPT